MRKLMKSLVLMVVIALVASSASAADTWYVKTDGNDSNDGSSWDNAWKSLRPINSTVTQYATNPYPGLGTVAAGDTVLVNAGTYDLGTLYSSGTGYDEGGVMHIQRNGADDKDSPITIKSYGGDAIFKNGYVSNERGNDGMILDGITIDTRTLANENSLDYYAFWARGDALTLQDCTIILGTDSSHDNRYGVAFELCGAGDYAPVLKDSRIETNRSALYVRGNGADVDRSTFYSTNDRVGRFMVYNRAGAGTPIELTDVIMAGENSGGGSYVHDYDANVPDPTCDNVILHNYTDPNGDGEITITDPLLASDHFSLYGVAGDYTQSPAYGTGVDGGNIGWDQVPEPATMVLLGLGGVGLLIRRRRRA
jgi:PEP-CTERM motif-containing protein